MKRFFLIIPILFFMFSCGENEKEYEKEQEIKPGADSVKTVDTTTQAQVDTLYPEEQKIEIGSIPSMSFQDKLKLLKTKYEVNYTEIHPEDLKVMVLDRFACEKKFIFHLQKKMPVKYGKVEKVFPVAHFHAYIYEDSTQCANALNNWYNCFGNDCNQVIPGTNTTIKSTPGFYIINQNNIICLDYALEHSENNWGQLTNHMRQLFETSQSIIIDVKPHGKMSWKKAFQ